MSETDRDTQGTVLVHCAAGGAPFVLHDPEPERARGIRAETARP